MQWQVFWLVPTLTTFPFQQPLEQWFKKDQKFMELTASGNAPEFPNPIVLGREHRIPILIRRLAEPMHTGK